jgi:hypothetical protein
MSRGLVLTTASLAAGLAFAAETARMELPDDFLAAAKTLAISGFGGRNSGEYRLGDGGGSFTRIESRFAVLDPLYESNRGRSSFTLAGPGFGSGISGDCSFRENVVSVGVLTFDPEKLAYACTLTLGDGSSAGSMTLGEPRPRSMRERLLAQAIRIGEAELGGVRVGIESVHRYAGSRLVADVPVGYTLKLGERLAGAVELTDTNPTIYLADAGDEAERIALLAAALSVAVLRDPANSALGD